MYAKKKWLQFGYDFIHPLMLGYFADNHYLCNINTVKLLLPL